MLPAGRLTLSWIGKDKALLGTPDGGYKWVERTDPRVAEVRLIEPIEEVGSVSQSLAEGNLLIKGDSYDALRALANIPEYASEYRGKVKLIYIDPPFNTGQAFADYDDALEHSVWLGMMRERLLLAKELLSLDGSLWVHLDSTEVHRARCLLDEIFGPQNYLATVVWQRTSTKSLARRTMGTMHESILVYGASDKSELKTVYLPHEDRYVSTRFALQDERGRYNPENLTAGYHRPHLDSGKPWRGFDPSERRRCWAVPSSLLLEIGLTEAESAKLTMREKLDLLDEKGYIYWPEKGGFPRYKKYLHKMKGRAVGDLWTDINVINSQAIERTGFSTQKPEALLQRVLEMGSKPGDIVLDYFAGSGTTAAVAHKMHRRWVAVERESATVESIIRPRLERIINGDDSGGITDTVGWEKGGGFRAASVRDSMYELLDGRVFLAEWVRSSEFAKAVCAQLGFSVDDEWPFVGRKGRTRLATIDGVADSETVRAIASRLDANERVVIVAKASTQDAERLLKKLSPGSRLRKAPRDLLERSIVR
ncbi:site-specific DNA-methyltransferase [Verrucosispora sp. SN26_14.1]|uniref:site-specific DNA-methyltransferase n=1 Tax=Verrucosispora sp. SN26_14.1 TaxID=2527879 RepID=UPI00103366AC|nr:site-specific DNA-methyltransferase [Verrucosispora sp. SN26_14.1]TBL41481.1 site-specific DNA-methyltransferase [Verrucosispora sp. SN26_14.1]